MSNNLSNTSGIGMKDKIGYALGDVGSLLVFGLVNTFLQIFYTDKLGITPLVVMLIMIIARVWDAINDPIWGRVVDNAPSKPRRRYKKWLLYLCLPLAFSSVLMFIDVNGWFHFSNAACIAYAIVSYIVFGMLYTGTNIPYGSMSSVITSDDKERNALSVFRSVGSTLGGFGPMIVNFFVWDKVDGVSVLNSTKLIIGVSILAVLSVICSILCYKFSEERIEVPARSKADRPKGETLRVLKNLVKTRSFVIISIVGMLFLAAQMFQTTYNMYVFKVFFNKPGMATLSTVCQYLPVAVVMFFSGKLVRKFGRKEICAIGLLFTAICFGILAVIPIGPIDRAVLMWIFLAFSLLAGLGNAFIFLMIWALANDSIDDYFVKTKSHDEATAYSIFTFMRKLGQTTAAIIVNVSLIAIGYGQSTDWVPTESAATSMYYQSIIIPAALSLAMFLLLMFVYPLSKKKVEALQEEKASALSDKAPEVNE
ncbi:MAG: glycoside-pentoside-hexuronide (GPH):cation symporter [Bacilli bacterium]|nr:glycoside-pentoside-hexuronide (GPH):cation symporter [Bacilli bacterium]